MKASELSPKQTFIIVSIIDFSTLIIVGYFIYFTKPSLAWIIVPIFIGVPLQILSWIIGDKGYGIYFFKSKD